MAVIIPTFQNKSSKFQQDIILGGVSITLSFYWNTRAGYWFITLFDGTNTLNSSKLVPQYPLIRRNRAFFPLVTGDIMALRTDRSAGDEITYDNLNDGFTLYYLDKEEIDTWEELNGI